MSEKLIYSAVAVPGEPDYDGEILTPEEISYAAHKFMSDYRVIDPEHVCALTKECYSVGKPVESTILTTGMTVKSVHGGNDMYLPKGTWILGIEVTDDSEWNRILNGERTGLSLTAARTTVKSRVLIRDLGKNWEAKTVSIVRDPAVPKAKFFQIIGDGMMNDEATKSRLQAFFDKIDEAVKSFKSDEVVDEAISEEPVAEAIEEDDPVEEVEVETSIKSEEEVETEEEPTEIEEETEEKTEEEEVEEVAEETDAEEAVKFVTADELQNVKEEILEAVKTLMQPATEDEAVKAEPEEEEESSEEEKKDDEDLDEIRKKDLKIAELEKKVEALEAKLKTANKSRSKGIPAHFDSETKAVKNLYDDDGRDMYGRVIR